MNRKPVSPPIRLPGSHDGLLATAHPQLDGGTGGMCNDFSLSFRHVSMPALRAATGNGHGRADPEHPRASSRTRDA